MRFCAKTTVLFHNVMPLGTNFRALMWKLSTQQFVNFSHGLLRNFTSDSKRVLWGSVGRKNIHCTGCLKGSNFLSSLGWRFEQWLQPLIPEFRASLYILPHYQVPTVHQRVGGAIMVYRLGSSSPAWYTTSINRGKAKGKDTSATVEWQMARSPLRSVGPTPTQTLTN